MAQNLWSVPDVMAEIRDRRARSALERLPFTLQMREPSAEAMSAVVNFSRKTGDFAHLSLTDLRVMALTYMLETEANGVAHLKTSPAVSRTITRDASGRIVSGSEPTVPCKFFGSAMGCKYGTGCKFLHDERLIVGTATDGSERPKVAIACRYFNTPEGCRYGAECQFEHKAVVNDPVEAEEAVVDGPVRAEVRNADVKSRILGGYGASSNAGALDDDGKNWIGVGNASQFLASPFGDTNGLEAVPAGVAVACITTDYSMQNVLLQVGLRLLSADGMLIKRVKQWILKCIACFATSTEMERLFCPKCGSHTMERVSYSLGPDGKMTFHTRANRPVKLAGTKFSLPKPKGGRDGDLLLREDQLMMGIWRQRQQQHKKVMGSAFGEHVAHDLGVKAEKHASIVVGYGRMNPNAQKGRERRGKKKRN